MIGSSDPIGCAIAEDTPDRANQRGQSDGRNIRGTRSAPRSITSNWFPNAARGNPNREPVMSLVPMPGDVDVVIASELMEAGRAIQRRLVTPDRTTLIASTNRVFAMNEKTALSDGRSDDASLLEACRSAAKKFYAFDMEGLAEATGSVISAVLFAVLFLALRARARPMVSSSRSRASIHSQRS
jgi:hypothetical protein